MIETQPTKYDKVAIALHWIIGILMIVMIFFGENLMGSEGGEEGEGVVAAAGGAVDTFLPSVHVSIGVTILVLTLVRILWRLMNPPPPLPASMAPWEVTLTKLTHVLFYVLMIGLPLTGWLGFPHFLTEKPAMSAISIFGVMSVPGAPEIGIPWGLFHNLGSKLGMALVALHVLAALKHQFITRDGLLARMSPH
jgi:cytochrome b561